MITLSPDHLQPAQWQKQLAQAVTDPAELIETLELPRSLLPAARLAAARFPLRVTRHYLGLIRPRDPLDPLLRQVLPLHAETLPTDGYLEDPVGDAAAALGAGVLHKYHGRALLITTGACAIHCRYCFRRHYPYGEDNAVRHWARMLKSLRERPDISEVILSGGDPLSLFDARLQDLVGELERMPQLQRLRIHTRLPVVLPERVTPALTRLLASSRLARSMVIHCNHPNELHIALRAPLRRLREDAGVTLLNQSVLLAGVNDHVPTLVRLSEKLFDFGVLPYYLHLLDPVRGAAHFDVDTGTTKRIEHALRERLPGYLVPRIVREIPGESSKTPLD
jgi:EF-P beta-lysylation protein EpmB